MLSESDLALRAAHLWGLTLEVWSLPKLQEEAHPPICDDTFRVISVLRCVALGAVMTMAGPQSGVTPKGAIPFFPFRVLSSGPSF